MSEEHADKMVEECAEVDIHTAPRHTARSTTRKRAASEDIDEIASMEAQPAKKQRKILARPTSAKSQRSQSEETSTRPSTPTSASPRPASSFLTALPREVRDLIYQYALHVPDGIKYEDAVFTDATRHQSYLNLSQRPPFHPEPCRLASKLSPNLLYTCRQIRAEAIDIPLKVNSINFHFRWAQLLAPPGALPIPSEQAQSTSTPSEEPVTDQEAAAVGGPPANDAANEAPAAMLWPYDSLTRYMMFKPRPGFLSYLRHVRFHYAVPVLEYISYDIVYHTSHIPAPPPVDASSPASEMETSKLAFPLDLRKIATLSHLYPKLKIDINIGGFDTDSSMIPSNYTHTLYTVLKMLEMVCTSVYFSSGVNMLFDGQDGGGSVVKVMPDDQWSGCRRVPRSYLELHGSRSRWIDKVVGRLLSEWPQFAHLERRCERCDEMMMSSGMPV